jgi:hypothetical protein
MRETILGVTLASVFLAACGDGGPAPAQRPFEAIAVGNDVLVAGGSLWVPGTMTSTGVLYRSVDGVTWTETAHTPQGVTDVQFGNGRFVALEAMDSSADDPSTWTHFAQVSTDGETWMRVQLPDRWISGRFAFGDGVFVARGEQGFLTSSDGVAWSVSGPGTSVPYGGVVYSGGHFVSWQESNPKVEVLTGGDWKEVTVSPVSHGVRTLDLTKDGFIARTFFNCCFGETGDPNYWATVRSTDGLKWTADGDPQPNKMPLRILLETATRCIATDGDNVLSGGDCAHLTATLSGGRPEPREALEWNGITFIAASGGIFTSPDATTWTKRR